jgi:integrase
VYLGDTLVKDIRQIHIQNATNDMIEKGLNTRNVGDALSVLRQCLDTAVANKIILVNPCVGIALPNDRVISERRVLEHWEQDLLLEVAEGRFYREVYHICLLTGMRIGEIGGLKWGDIDFEKKEIHVNRSLSVSYDKGKHIEMTTPKTANSVRTIPFFDDVEDYLMAWRKKQNEAKVQCGSMWRNTDYGDLVFTTSLGSPLTKYAFQHDIKKVVEDMKAIEIHRAMIEGRKPREISNIYPHAFRHTFATRCFENDMNPIFVQRVMGHSNYSTTASYTHILDTIRERERMKTTNFLDGGKPKSDGCVNDLRQNPT